MSEWTPRIGDAAWVHIGNRKFPAFITNIQEVQTADGPLPWYRLRGNGDYRYSTHREKISKRRAMGREWIESEKHVLGH